MRVSRRPAATASVFLLVAASLAVLLPALPMVIIPGACGGAVDCVSHASLSCVMFGIGAFEWDSQYFLSTGAGCHLPQEYAALAGTVTNTTVASSLGD